MFRIIAPLAAVSVVMACSSNGSNAVDGGGSVSSNGRLQVVACDGNNGGDDTCPFGSCDDTHGAAGDVLTTMDCSAYASWVNGSTAGLCSASETGSYALDYADPAHEKDAAALTITLVNCEDGKPTVQDCSDGVVITTGSEMPPTYKCQ